MFCCTLLYVHSCFAIILMGKREVVALHSLSSWCSDCCVALPRGVMGLSAVCDCGISCSYSLIVQSKYCLMILLIFDAMR